MKPEKREKLQGHLHSLFLELDIAEAVATKWRAAWAECDRKSPRIGIPWPLKTELDYFVAMHELGHIAIDKLKLVPRVTWDTPMGVVFKVELAADEWALKNAVIAPDGRTIRVLAALLSKYWCSEPKLGIGEARRRLAVGRFPQHGKPEHGHFVNLLETVRMK